MKQIKLGNTEELVSQVVLGCMRINEAGKEPVEVINVAYENGINFFDHADIYGDGECERIFANAFRQTGIDRNDVFIQSKCGIVPGKAFDFSTEHIIQSVEGSLRRLKTDYLDSLLLHRPDTLFIPEEVAEAFYQLEKAGKVKYFGVSNQKPLQIELLKTAVKQPLVANQLQFGLGHTGMIDSGIYVNMKKEAALDRDGSILEYSRIKQMTIQAWSPFQYGFFDGTFIGNNNFPVLNQKLNQLAVKYQVSPAGIATSWINSHPANFQTVIGTMTTKRIIDITKGADIHLSREEWYDLYQAAGNLLP
ncbi:MULTISPECIES: aldo/keto reductase [unclassified Enterococcus]|uniref:aldo/keto reductase n=1 Tax=unclassified Enterococcus TaxID=2608891 RepID=UPI001557255A|nr:MULTISPECIES: aldo/keto reductase [unclassified Enterococcus]MBS7576209.1 aldo/keto reductase [Enterococcus sp. MMGLQ5-2]MBS7583442.1 aldo/keto reductase [Enterococcus sp. MMGLQ5-1]NPD11302.1 aldo/keto reductase [Enterococcus sp. MMGLQ5-1]NPD36045.1 aldo/keto reductase [Enterococcus sp. MMGLQ5-2]